MTVANLRSYASPALRGLGALALLAAVTGCSMGPMQMSGTLPQSGSAVTIKGNVHGGQQPVSGATIKLYAAGSSGYGSGATSLLSQAVTTGADGSFSITGDYTCPTVAGGSQLYIVATGGNPGITGTVNNTYIAEMAALGTCPSGGTLSSSLTVNINEYTTVAAVAALQQFMAAPAGANSGAPNIGAPSTAYSGYAIAQSGLKNAFNMVPLVADLSTGLAPAAGTTAASYATPEATKVGLIANILAYCVNSDPGSSNACTTLMADATPTGSGFTATDTIQAALYMLRSASYYAPFYTSSGTATSAATATSNVAAFNSYVSTLIGLASGFQVYPAAATANDFTIAVALTPVYNTSSLALSSANSVAPYIAFDQYGNAWAMTNSGGVTELSPSGTVLLPPVTSFTASTTGGTYSQFTSAPASNTRSFTGVRGSMAIDTTGRPWVPNFGDSAGTPIAGSIAVFNASSGAGVASSGVSTGYYTGASPFSVSIDGNNNVFLTQVGLTTGAMDNKSLGLFSAGSSAYSYSTSTTATAPYALATSSTSGSTWVAVDSSSSAFAWVNQNQGCKLSSNQPVGAMDQFSQSLAPTAQANYAAFNGYGGSNCTSASGINTSLPAATQNTYGLAVDRYNNLWFVDEYTSSNGFDGVSYEQQNTALNTTGSSSTGVLSTSTSYVDNGAASGTNIKKPFYSAVDGNNTLWIANNGLASLTTAAFVSGTGVVLTSPTGGYAHSTLGSGYGIAIDPSGNVWATGYSTSTFNNAAGSTSQIANSVTVLLGAAAPVVTPTSLAIANGKLGQKP